MTTDQVYILSVVHDIYNELNRARDLLGLLDFLTSRFFDFLDAIMGCNSRVGIRQHIVEWISPRKNGDSPV